MADTQNLMFTTLFEHAMTMLRDHDGFNHEQYESFSDYMDDSTAHWKRVRSLLDICRHMAEEIDLVNDEFNEIEDFDDIEEEDSDDESVTDNETVEGQNV